MVRRCWVSFQCWGVLLIWIIVGQGPVVLAVGAGGGCLDIFSLICPFSPLSPSLWETARYRLKYCFKGPLNPKQPTNQPIKPKRLIFNGVHFGVYITLWHEKLWYILHNLALKVSCKLSPKSETVLLCIFEMHLCVALQFPTLIYA